MDFVRSFADSAWSTAVTVYNENPVHVVLEVVLVLAILYIIVVKRSYDPKQKGYGARAVSGLSDREKDELIADWEPEPLVSNVGPAAVIASSGISPAPFTIVDYVPGGRNVKVHVEGDASVKTSFCSMDFLALGSAPETVAAATSTLEEYSLGSCGPRGFYGTTIKHLDLEQELAVFMGTEESITYSDGMAAVASAIPAFAKRGDVLLVDAGCSHAILTGAKLSRSKVIFFAHNDLADLAKQLEGVAKADRTKRNDSLSQRRFIVVEGLYGNYGDVCPLKDVVALAKRYKWRTIVDDTCGVGVLGATGKGIIEHCGLDMGQVDILLGSLATTLGSVGGFCVGSREVVDHQRLSGAGYCFSASAPPFLCATATTALKQMTSAEGKGKLATLTARSKSVHALLAANPSVSSLFTVVSDPLSPIKHLQLKAGAAPLPIDVHAHIARTVGASSTPSPSSRSPSADLLLPSAASLDATPRSTIEGLLTARVAEEKVLDAVVKAVAAAGYLVTFTHYLPTELLAPRPTLKFYVSLAQEDKDLQGLVNAIGQAAAKVAGGSASAVVAVGGAAATASSEQPEVNGSGSSAASGPAASAGVRQRGGRRT